MLIWEKVDLNDTTRYPPVLFEDINDPRVLNEDIDSPRVYFRAKLPVSAIWNKGGYTRYCYQYDFTEQLYKKRKMYFHIEDRPQIKARAVTVGKRIFPMVFFAMDERMCGDFFRIAHQNTSLQTAYLHQCVNIEPMELFNPDSISDIRRIPSNVRTGMDAMLTKLRDDIKSRRFWRVMESNGVTRAVYGVKEFDGIALDFQSQASHLESRTEGLCLFDRAEDKIKVARIAVVPMQDIRESLTFDPRRYLYENPQAVVENYNAGKYAGYL
jgi:hypothetical protein